MQYINDTGYLNHTRNTMFFILEKVKENPLGYFVRYCKSIYSIYRMTQYTSVNKKLSGSKLSKFNFGVKRSTGVTLRLIRNILVLNEMNFPQNCYHIINKLQIFLSLSKINQHPI